MTDDHDANTVSHWVPSFCLSSSVSHFASPPPLSGTHRLCECMCLSDEDVYCEIMQQADVSALRLFEALVVTLPQTLLQTYVLICTDIGIKSPGIYRLHSSGGQRLDSVNDDVTLNEPTFQNDNHKVTVCQMFCLQLVPLPSGEQTYL